MNVSKKKKKTSLAEPLDKGEKERKIRLWILGISLLLGLIIGGILIYQERARQQKLAKLQARLQELQELQNRDYRQYQFQELNLISTTSLAESPTIHSFFSDLLRKYSEKFAKSKELDISGLSLSFEGLYYDPRNSQGLGEMGRCGWETLLYPPQQKVAEISLNRLYLLNKLGQDKYFIYNVNLLYLFNFPYQKNNHQ